MVTNYEMLLVGEHDDWFEKYLGLRTVAHQYNWFVNFHNHSPQIWGILTHLFSEFRMCRLKGTYGRHAKYVSLV